MLRLLPALILVAACGGASEPAAPTLEELAAEKCPRVGMDRMGGDYVLKTGDVKVRFRVADVGGKTMLYLSDPSVSNHRLAFEGTKRPSDWQFDEVLTGKRKALVEAGGETVKRLYVAPKLRSCTIEVFAGAVDAEGNEVVPPNPKVFLQAPEGKMPDMTWEPADEPLFLGAAAEDAAKADAELAQEGGPGIMAEMGRVVAGAWSQAADDGAEDCTYTLDAYLDDMLVDGGREVPAKPPTDGRRAWGFVFDAPYTGNHRLELVRYRQCGDGPRERIGHAGADVVLQ